jgi:hypothetical protein
MKTSVKQFVILSLFSTVLLLSAVSCKQSVTGPVKVEDITPGRRDYIWTVDTLFMPGSFIDALWGPTPNDLWCCSAGGSAVYWTQHYDGTTWKAYIQEVSISGESLFGFSKNDVWQGGQGGVICHYNGTRWNDNFTYKVDGAYEVHINYFTGLRPDDIYACGIICYNNPNRINNRGFALHYDGHTWKEVCKGEDYCQLIQILQDKNGKVYVFGCTDSDINSSEEFIKFYELKGSTLNVIYSDKRKNIHWGVISYIEGQVCFLINSDIYSYNDGWFIKILSMPNENFSYDFYGRSIKDIIYPMFDGIAHYNGEDIQYIYRFPLYKFRLMYTPVVFEKDIFYFLFDVDHGKNLILHGKLKD